MSTAADLFKAIHAYLSKRLSSLSARIDAVEAVRVRDMTEGEKAQLVESLKTHMEARHAAWALEFERSAQQIIAKSIPAPTERVIEKELVVRDITQEERESILSPLKDHVKGLHASWALDFERSATQTMLKAIADIPEPKDGLSFDEVEGSFDPERGYVLSIGAGDRRKEIVLPYMRHIGFWRDGMTAKSGNTATDQGSLWVCVKDTSERPSYTSQDWALAARKGRDGQDKTDAKPVEPVKLNGN